MVESQQMQYCGVEVVDVDDVFHGFIAKLVCCSVTEGGFHTGTGKPAGEAFRIMVSATGTFLKGRHATKFRTPDYKRVFQQSTLLQILNQCGGRLIHPRTRGPADYMQTIRDNALVFCTGPAGTGKTYLAVATAVEALRAHRVRTLVLVRPAVEAGESLGFLPGDLQAKINPYLRPLLDALGDMIDRDQIQRYMDEDVIEVVPLAYMRGRTLNNAFIIMDEAQNTTVAQMKMFLTRMGEGSQIVVSGDTTQIDLPPHTKSGLIDALSRLRDIEGFAKVHLSTEDIVRHRLVQDIVRAYEESSKKKR